VIGLGIGILLVWGTLGVWMVVSHQASFGGQPFLFDVITDTGMLALLLCAPVASFMVARAIHSRREIIALTGVRRVQVGALVWGVVVGLIGAVLGSVLLAYCRVIAQERLVLLACGAAASFVLLLARRRQPWACRVCGYDLRATLGRVPCPECGRVVEVSGDRR
jgi:hypothetical protein